MRKLHIRRPSAGMIVAIVALVAALGGTAIAGNRIHFDMLAKDSRQKVLPYGATAATAECNPTSTTFVDCGSVKLSVSKQFARRAMVVADGLYTTDDNGARGTCRLQVDGNLLGGPTVHIGAGAVPDATPQDGLNGNAHADPLDGAGFGINTLGPSLTGLHTYSLACNETTEDIKIRDVSITAMTMRGT